MPPPPAIPGKRTFRDPSLGQEGETLDARWPRDNLQTPDWLKVLYPGVQRMIVILAVSPDHLESWILVLLQVLKNERSGSRIVQSRLRDDNGKQQAQRIDENVPLAAGEFLAAVVAPLPADLRGFRGLAVDAGSAGSWLSSHRHADPRAQGVQHVRERCIHGVLRLPLFL